MGEQLGLVERLRQRQRLVIALLRGIVLGQFPLGATDFGQRPNLGGDIVFALGCRQHRLQRGERFFGVALVAVIFADLNLGSAGQVVQAELFGGGQR